MKNDQMRSTAMPRETPRGTSAPGAPEPAPSEGSVQLPVQQPPDGVGGMTGPSPAPAPKAPVPQSF